jgi:hypothetical protein
MATREDHRATRDQSQQQAHDWSDGSSDFVLVQEVQPPPRIELARERMLMCRLYLGLIQTISDDYGAKRRLRRGVCGPQRQFNLANRWHLRLSPHRHVFARWRR